MTAGGVVPATRAEILAYAHQMAVGLRRVIDRAVTTRTITPESVYAYAALHLRTDNGIPIAPANHHRTWMELVCNPAIEKLLIIAPPESAKTTWLISGFAGLHLGVYPERSIILASTSGQVAEKRSLSLRVTVEQAIWQATFPGVRRAIGLPWKVHEWSLAPNGIPHAGRLHPSVAAYGTGGAVIGSRADVIIADDLLDFRNTGTAHQRAFVESWFHSILLSRRKSQTGRIIVIGTSYHHDDLYERIKRDGSWVVCHMPLLSNTQQVIATLTYPDLFVGTRLGAPIAPQIEV